MSPTPPSPTALRFRARIRRKQADLPRYVVVDAALVAGRTASFPALVSLGDAGPFPRTIHPWGKGSADFFFNLTAPQCRKAGLDTDDDCDVTLVAEA